MTRKFADLIRDFPPERRAKIERRKKELEDEMGVRRINLETDEVEHDSREGHDIVPEHEHIWDKMPPIGKTDLEPRLEEHPWVNPDQAEFEDKVENIISRMTDEEREKLAESLHNIDKEYGQE